MIAAVADTHTVLWYLFADTRLSRVAKAIIEDALGEGRRTGVSAMTLAEILYLVEKGRAAPQTFDRVLSILADPSGPFLELHVDSAVVSAMQMIPREEVADLPDRVIAATALRYGVPVVSCDRRIRAASVESIW